MKMDECPGWHVIIGDNGTGKSSIIRSLAILFAGGPKVSATRQIWETWVSKGAGSAEIRAQFVRDTEFDQFILKGKQPDSYTLRARIDVGAEALSSASSITFNVQNTKLAERTIWASGTGWFSSSFGPFRRFSGGDRDWDRLFVSPEYTRIAAHLSAFGEDVAFTEALYWMTQLKVSTFEDSSGKNQRKLDSIIRFVNESKLLPHGSILTEVTTKSVNLKDARHSVVTVDQMSDGYRSVLSLTFELIRQMFLAYGEDVVLNALDEKPGYVNLPGVVAIDEIDAHLHPVWQTNIGEWFVAHFPRIQFFVTTHSPLVCRAARKGSIWRLPAPGGYGTPERIVGEDFDRLIKGNVLDAYGTDFFGEGIDTPSETKELAKQIARLSMLRSTKGLSNDQEDELRRLQSTLPTSAARFV